MGKPAKTDEELNIIRRDDGRAISHIGGVITNMEDGADMNIVRQSMMEHLLTLNDMLDAISDEELAQRFGRNGDMIRVVLIREHSPDDHTLSNAEKAG